MNDDEKVMPISGEQAEVEKKETVCENEILSTQTDLLENESEAEHEEDFSDVLSHPMFARFAKGKRGNIEEICLDFREMLSSMPKTEISDVSAKMTPSVAGNASPDVALTERQRMIARAAGMTYREYYTLVNNIPVKK